MNIRTNCNCHDPLPRETGWYPGEEGPCTCKGCNYTPWCGPDNDKEVDDFVTTWDEQNALNEEMEKETTECDWCNRFMPNDSIKEMGPVGSDGTMVPVLARCKDIDECEAHMSESFIVIEDNTDDIPF